MPFESSQTLRFGNCDPSGIAYLPAYFSMHVRRIGNSLFDFETFARVRGAVIWSVGRRIVLISAEDHRPRPWPDDVRAALETYINPPA